MVRVLNDGAGEQGHQHAADGAGGATQAHNRAGNGLRKHVRCRREKIRRPTLMSRQSQAQQRDGQPALLCPGGVDRQRHADSQIPIAR